MNARLQVRDYMSRHLVTLHRETEVMHAVHMLTKKEISGAPVIDTEGRLIGLLTEKDCLRAVLNASYYSEYGGTVEEIMTTEVETMEPDLGLVDAAKRFVDKGFHRYPVVDDGTLIGQISRSDVMRALSDVWQ